MHFGSNGQTQQNCNNVGKGVLRRLRQLVEYAALADQVTEHQEAYQCNGFRRHQTGNGSYHDGEHNLGGFAYIACMVFHTDQALFLGSYSLDHRRLDNGHQCHIRVRSHHNGAQILGMQCIGHKDGSGAVGSADNGDGRGVVNIKEETGHKESEENTELGGCTEEHQPRVLQQRAKVDHGADTDKQQQREQLVGNACIKQYGYGAFLRPGLGNGAAEGQIHQNGAEAHGQQQGGFHFLLNGKVDQHAANHPHHDHTGINVAEVGEQRCKFMQWIHVQYLRVFWTLTIIMY